MIKINLLTVIRDIDGSPLLHETKDKTQRESMLKDFVLRALAEPDPKEVDLETKLRIGRLMQDIFAKDEIELKSEEVSLIKEKTAKIFTPIVVVQVCDLVDPKIKE